MAESDLGCTLTGLQDGMIEGRGEDVDVDVVVMLALNLITCCALT